MMVWRRELQAVRGRWQLLTLYQRFEEGIVLFLTGLIGLVIIAAVWNLALKVLYGLILSNQFDPADPMVFQTVFGMIFTVIIALEFKRSLVVIAERKDTIVQVRTVILIAMLAVVRKLIILDLTTTNAPQLFALAAAMLALGGIYWLARYQDQRDSALQNGDV
jgi:uncharacterized membrane protein (DUF373 family)